MSYLCPFCANTGTCISGQTGDVEPCKHCAPPMSPWTFFAVLFIALGIFGWWIWKLSTL